VVGQIKIVGILMMVNGAIIAIVGALYAAMGPMMMAIAPPPPAAGGGPPPELFLIIYGVLGGVILISGAVNVVAGFRVMSMRNRVFGIVALFLNVVSLITCYCAPLAIAMMIYGLVVLFQPDVSQAFDAVARGATQEEAIRKHTRRYDDVRDDYDEMSGSRRQWDEDRRRRRDQNDEPRLDADEDSVR